MAPISGGTSETLTRQTHEERKRRESEKDRVRLERREERERKGGEREKDWKERTEKGRVNKRERD